MHKYIKLLAFDVELAESGNKKKAEINVYVVRCKLTP